MKNMSKTLIDVLSEGLSSAKGLHSKRRRFAYIFHVVVYPSRRSCLLSSLLHWHRPFKFYQAVFDLTGFFFSAFLQQQIQPHLGWILSLS
jgi:hypothetical protein